jgi:alanine dehydrogenase
MTKQTVGVPKEIKAQERRVSRQPDSAAELAHNGRESFLLQSGASERGGLRRGVQYGDRWWSGSY